MTLTDVDAVNDYVIGSNYGYTYLAWSLANKVREVTYKIKVGTEYETLSIPTSLSGFTDVQHKYGHVLPLREYVLIGEEIVVVFTEPVRCITFTLMVRINRINQTLNCNSSSIQITNDGHKIGFKINPTEIANEKIKDKDFTITIENPSRRRKCNIFDLNESIIKSNIIF